MDLVGYAVLGSLERIAIVVGAVVIGYWGYRLYAGEKNAGLVFMGLAVLILGGALATGASHEGYQLATLPEPAATATAPEAVPASSVSQTAPVGVDPAAAASVPAPAEPSPYRTAPTDGAVTASEPVAQDVDASTAEEPVAETVDDAPVGVVAEVSSPERIATGQELGGRIVSIKSENVSLEWSNDSE